MSGNLFHAAARTDAEHAIAEMLLQLDVELADAGLPLIDRNSNPLYQIAGILAYVLAEVRKLKYPK